MKNLILGAPGQDAYYMARLLEDLGETYAVVGRRQSNNSHYDFLAKKMVMGDLCDKSFVDSIIESFRPQHIYNFAGLSNIDESFKNPAKTISNNTSIQTNILDAVKTFSKDSKVYFASSIESFKLKSPYGISKQLCHEINNYYKSNYNIFIASGVNCQHNSIYRDSSFFWGKVCNYVANLKRFISLFSFEGKIIFNITTIQCGKDTFPKLRLGNLEISRDILSCEDVVDAAKLILEKGDPINYIVTSGNLYSNKLILELAFKQIGIDNWQDFCFEDKSLFRPKEDIGTIYYSNHMEKQLGWKPKKKIEALLKESVEYNYGRAI